MSTSNPRDQRLLMICSFRRWKKLKCSKLIPIDHNDTKSIVTTLDLTVQKKISKIQNTIWYRIGVTYSHEPRIESFVDVMV